MNQKELKKQRIDHLLKLMSVEPMNCHQMADAVNIGIKSFSKYLTQMRFKKLVHIARYDRNTIGSYTVYYMAGDFPDVVKPEPLGRAEWNRRYKEKTKRPKVSSFTPRPDYAAAWLFNPIGDQNAEISL